MSRTILKDMFVHISMDAPLAHISLKRDFYSSGAGSCLGLEKNACQVFERDTNFFVLIFFLLNEKNLRGAKNQKQKIVIKLDQVLLQTKSRDDVIKSLHDVTPVITFNY